MPVPAIANQVPEQPTLRQLTAQRRQRCVLRYELQRQTVVTPALAARGWSILEYVTLMAAAAGTVVLGPGQNHAKVGARCNMAIEWLREAGPAGATLEFVPRIEQRQKASRA